MSSSAKVRVDKATSRLLLGPDWTLNMEICDSINSDQWQARDVIKAVKKRLQNKNPKVQFLALTLLETLVKNCGDYVHFQVVERDILGEMTKIVRKKTDMQVRVKILSLLDSWQEAFGGPGGKHPQYYWAYAELKRSGVVFPQRSANAPPIFTPPVAYPTSTSNHPHAGYDMPSNGAVTFDEAMASEMGNLSLSDLNDIRSVMELLNEMLRAVNPYDPGAVRDELIADLVNQSRTNQKKLMQLVSSTGDEELLGQGLELYDNIQSLLMKHDAIVSGSPLPLETSESTSMSKMPVTSTPVSTSQIEDEEEEEEDDGFAQLAQRNSKFKPLATQNTFVCTADQEASPNRSDVTTATTGSGASEASSSVASNALVLLDPPPVRTVKQDQDMIDLLSLTLPTDPSSPHTLTPLSTSNQNGSLLSASSTGDGDLHNPQLCSLNQGYSPYNSYVAPWAQHALPPPPVQPPSQPKFSDQAQPSFQPQPSPHAKPLFEPQPPFIAQSPFKSQPPLQPQPPAQAQLQTLPPFQAQLPFRPQSSAQTQSSQYSSIYPPPPWAFPASPNPSPFPLTTYQLASSQASSAACTPDYSSRPRQQYDSFGSRVNNVPIMTGEKQVNASQRQTGSAAAPKPYYLPDRLFEDLIDLRNPSGGTKSNRSTSLSGTSSQPMISGRK